MRKVCLLTCALCLLLVGCGTAPAPDKTPATTTTTTTDTPVTTPTVVIPEGFLTEEQALQIAYDYWNITPGDTVSVGTGSDTDAVGTAVVEVYLYPTEEAPFYEMVYSWYVPQTDHKSVLDRMWIDAVTGKAGADLLS